MSAIRTHLDLEAFKAFLHRNGWESTTTSRGFERFVPPSSQGLPESFKIFLPHTLSSSNEAALLDNAIGGVAELYGISPRQFFLPERSDQSDELGHTRPSIWFHFDGDIAEDHQLSLRTLGKTTLHLQAAIDRAYLDVEYGSITKHQRLKKDHYADVEFKALQPREGGFILESVAAGPTQKAGPTLDRLNGVLTTAYEKETPIESSSPSVIEQAIQRSQVFERSRDADTYLAFVERDMTILSRAYGERSINKEIDQVLSLVRITEFENSVFELFAYGTRSGPKFVFDSARAHRFHDVISERRVGEPLEFFIELRSLDAGRDGQMAKGKAKNLQSSRECNLFIADSTVFSKLSPHLKKKKRKALRVIACPLYEYDAWDPQAGDLVIIKFIEIAEDSFE